MARKTQRLEVMLAPDEPIPAPGSDYHGMTVVVSYPDMAHLPEARTIIVDAPVRKKFGPQALVADPNIPVIAARPEPSDYRPVDESWLPAAMQPAATRSPEEHRLQHGITPALQAAGNWGAGKALYVVDTGVVPGKPGFVRKPVRWLDPSGGEPRDKNGHGHWCTGSAGGEAPYGCCPDADTTAVLALPNDDGSGAVTDVANAFDAVGADMRARGLAEAAVFASLGGSDSAVIRTSMARLIQQGAVCFVAAGNAGNEAALGSPANATAVQAVNGSCNWAWGNSAFSSGLGDSRVRFYPIGEQVPGPNKDGGPDIEPSGTSMGPKTVGGAAVLVANALGISIAAAVERIHATLAAQAGSGGRRYVIDAAALGIRLGGEPPPPPPARDPLEEHRAITAEVRRIVTRAQEQRPPWGAPDYAMAIEAIFSQIGAIKDYTHQLDAIAEALPKAEPRPEPVPTALHGVYGSYPGHDPAVDVYPGWDEDQVAWGPHHGLPLIAPAPGTVQALALPTPLEVLQALSAEEQQLYAILLEQWTCWAVDPQQTMHVAVYRPDTPLQTSGAALRLILFGHAHQQMVTGRVVKDQQFGRSWDSGIRFENAGNPVARAAHVHVAASQSGQVLPNGDVDGRYGCEAMGWQVSNVGTVPGPDQYRQPNVYCAGRLYRDFQAAGRQPPPIPA